MPETLTVPIEQFYDQKTPIGLVTEASSFRTVPSNSYTIQVSKVEGKTWGANGADLGRDGAHLTASVLQDGKKISTVFFNVSWQEKRTLKGYLDTQSRLWGQLGKALYADKTDAEISELGVGAIVDAALKYPVRGYIIEGFKVPDPTFYTGFSTKVPRTPEEAIEYRKLGYKQVNNVQSISKFV